MSRDTDLGVALYSRRVLIKSKTDNILPKWLRFVKGKSPGNPSLQSTDYVHNRDIRFKCLSLISDPISWLGLGFNWLHVEGLNIRT